MVVWTPSLGFYRCLGRWSIGIKIKDSLPGAGDSALLKGPTHKGFGLLGRKRGSGASAHDMFTCWLQIAACGILLHAAHVSMKSYCLKAIKIDKPSHRCETLDLQGEGTELEHIVPHPSATIHARKPHTFIKKTVRACAVR